MIYWFLGQPGHGKTVLSNLLKKKLESFPNAKKVFSIDGDDLRLLTSNQDYSRTGREENMQRAQFISHYLHQQGYDVIVSLVSPYRELREEFKSRIKDIKEIYVFTTQIRGKEKFHTLEFEPPLKNFIAVDTTLSSPDESLSSLLYLLNIGDHA
jgi:adenylylsulfate kinase